jgi:hypothetical protein
MISIQNGLLILAVAIVSEASATTITYEGRANDPADFTGASWSSFSTVPALSSSDYLNGLPNALTAVPGSTAHSAGASLSSGLAILNNGAGSTANDQTVIVGTDGDSSSYTRLLIDLQNTVHVQQFNSYNMAAMDGTRNYQRYSLYGSNAGAAPTQTGDPLANGWSLIANVATDAAWATSYVNSYQTGGVSVSNINQSFRYLLFDAHIEDALQSDGTTAYNGNHYVELDVVGSVVPEPTGLVLVMTGLVGLLCYAWRKRR